MFRVRRNWRFQRTIPTSAIHVIWSQEYQVRFDRGMSMHFAVFLRVRQKSSEECARFSTPVLGEQSHSLCLDYWMCLCIQHVSRVELAGQQVHIISSHLLTFALAQFSKKSNTQEKPYFSLHMLVSVWNLSRVSFHLKVHRKLRHTDGYVRKEIHPNVMNTSPKIHTSAERQFRMVYFLWFHLNNTHLSSVMCEHWNTESERNNTQHCKTIIIKKRMNKCTKHSIQNWNRTKETNRELIRENDKTQSKV